jgi:hypothetical protein
MKSLSLVTVLVPLLVACGSDSTGTSSGTTSSSGGSSSGGQVAAKGPGDFAADYKTSSAFFTNMAAPVKGSSPHGTQRTWYSSNIKGLVSQASFTAPEGTVAIKEFDMTGDGTKTGIAVMIKKAPGYDAENGDWYYDMRDTAGKVQADPPAGKIAMCIGCHKGYKATDYLGATTMK